jgi:hypothetical protein
MCNCNERQTKEWAEDMAQKVERITGEPQEVITITIADPANGEIYSFQPVLKDPIQ